MNAPFSLQGDFFDDLTKVARFRRSLSEARIQRYLAACRGEETDAVKLYAWNGYLSQALYLSLQTWEIALRNRLNAFLCWRYNHAWPYDHGRAVRQLASGEARRLREATQRQEQKRKSPKVPTDAIVADLSAGFWVALLTKSYDVPFAWPHNLPRVFPNDRSLRRAVAASECGAMLDLRNRIAHHEPIFHLPLVARHKTLMRLISAMCDGSHDYALASCRFLAIWNARPRPEIGPT
jgi:hypothetical protein